MKKFVLFNAVLLAAFFSSCSQEELMPQEEAVIEIFTEITDFPHTRTQLDPGGKGAFSEGDRITLMAFAGTGTAFPFGLTLQNGNWTPSLNWSDIQSAQSRFTACYPALEGQDLPDFIHSVELDQRSAAAQTASDLLIAAAEGVRGQPVRLSFRHAMSRILVHLKSDGSYSDEELASAVITAEALPQIPVHLEQAVLDQAAGNVGKMYFGNVGGTSFQLILCPQAIRPEWREHAFLEIEIGGRHVAFKAPLSLADGSAFDSLESGRQVVLDLTLKTQGEPEIDWRNKTAWVYGLKDMPPLEQWGLYSNDPYQGQPHPVPGLTWKPEYGWFDCNKIDPVGNSADDNSMCWAATCSNLLHWWMQQNAANISRYGKYDGPRLYPNSYDSEIFSFYKQHFTNEGYFIPLGLKWFFTGEFRDAGQDSARPQRKHNGFFRDVISTPDIGAASSYGLTETLKQVLLEKKAIGLEILLKAGRGAHALTIWGAGFDENGEVEVLYIAENNDRFQEDQVSGPMRPGKLCSAGLYAHRVQRQSDGSYRMESAVPGRYSIIIQTLIFLGTNDADWETYFQKVG